ncbi:hypothetical protein M427DRAFT_388893 [Gonapodya prolifera JEL478]|uniref:Zn(2)-C6 fungal-type domain-containing protein n=1 Tax=Gonapodya prolifera (strain JEL478) TaxID=1344416 RepID=A0A139A8U6_GONPJ|nr:hypothetical protein M427DRAFT_388893 [Gonapodya prolifera JEL478]|eukprot:KXS12813.1 hypothetical protein M427DRAFT_388893 [Gonapodya prolifera JEL478]
MTAPFMSPYVLPNHLSLAPPMPNQHMVDLDDIERTVTHLRASSSASGKPKPATKKRKVEGAEEEEGNKRATACNTCRKLHDRCDGMEPCARCTKKGIECSYDRPKNHPGPQKGWLDELSSRIVALEQNIRGELFATEAPIGDSGQQAKLKRNLKKRLESAIETVETFIEEVRKDRGLDASTPLLGEGGRLLSRIHNRGSDGDNTPLQSPRLPPPTDHTDLSALVSSYPFATTLVNGILGAFQAGEEQGGHHFLNGVHQNASTGANDTAGLDGNHQSLYELNLPPRIIDDGLFSSALSADELLSSLDSFLENGLAVQQSSSSIAASGSQDLQHPTEIQRAQSVGGPAITTTSNGGGQSSLLGTADAGTPMRRRSSLYREVSMFDDLPPLPPQDDMNRLLEMYYEDCWAYRHIYPVFPCTHRPTFCRRLPSQNPFLAFAMMAVGSLSEHNTPIAKTGFQLFQRCKRLLLPSLETTHLHHSTIEALLLYGRYANVHERSIAYMTIGMAIARAREIGLLLDPQDDDVSGRWGVFDWREGEERRRTGWAVFLYDRTASMVVSRTPLLAENEIRLTPPRRWVHRRCYHG